jgi:hypothetical protein
VKCVAISILVLAVVLAQSAERARPSREELERARRSREFAHEVQFGRIPAGAVVTYTNVEGMVLGLALSATNILAGDYLPAVMIVSNASPVKTPLRYHGTTYDTSIGDFVAQSESGSVLPKVFRSQGQLETGSPPSWQF